MVLSFAHQAWYLKPQWERPAKIGDSRIHNLNRSSRAVDAILSSLVCREYGMPLEKDSCAPGDFHKQVLKMRREPHLLKSRPLPDHTALTWVLGLYFSKSVTS